ncbi:hypothetical protein FIU87_02970 [Bacillus sp. THAF10]|nr:hypothetical protein FIU87_02970 [Bacillus sp. THAF10]
MEALISLGILFYLIPIIIVALVLIWIYKIKQNSVVMVRQNREIIRLLKERSGE